MLPKPISELLDESEQQVVTGYFDVTGEWLRIVDGSQLCVYTPSLIQNE
ncbi:MAG: hypothetical protein MJ201_04430 [Mycoplasmoidaceae bacterium]|nr:hypothetical protein [Mycoplasmoidaceae bacterium]